MSKKIFFLIGGLLLLIVIVIIAFSTANKKPKKGDAIYYNSEVEFLSEERKAYFGLAPETKVQVLDYDDGHEIYRIISNDTETE